MIKISNLISQNSNKKYQNLDFNTFKKLFTKNCRNIKSIEQAVYRGARFQNSEFNLFNSQIMTGDRISSYVNDGIVDSFYNYHFSTSQD